MKQGKLTKTKKMWKGGGKKWTFYLKTIKNQILLII